LIETGAVAVNGHVVTTLPLWVDPHADRITVHGKPLRTGPPLVYVLLYKPRGVVCTSDDPEGRRIAVDLVRHPSRVRLYAVGRLDADSTGLLLLTNDGELSNRLTHPRYHLPKVYEVTVRGELTADAAAKLQEGLFLPGAGRRRAGRTARARLEVVRRDRERTRLRLELHEGRNRQVRRMMARLGHPVRRLRRIELGPLRLAGLRSGQWRDLTPPELKSLRAAAGLGPKARPGARPGAAARAAGRSGSRRAGPPGSRSSGAA
jgi:pseudouridine synthase